MSNKAKEGYTGIGKDGWHVDGVLLVSPFKVLTMHFWNVSKDGTTFFAPSKEVIDSLSSEERNFWEQLYYINSRDN